MSECKAFGAYWITPAGKVPYPTGYVPRPAPSMSIPGKRADRINEIRFDPPA